MNILHKLGLYRASEIDNILKGATEVSRKAAKVAKTVNSHSHAVAVLKTYCKNQQDCAECIFHNDECKLAHTPPCWW